MRRAPDEPSPLQLLGVDRRAPWEEVRRAFRDAVRATHPDLHAGDPDAERRLKELNAVWESVNTPGKWAAYILQPAPETADGGSTRRRRGPVAPTLGRLHVRRQRRGATGLRRWLLELDGDIAASLENGATSTLDVAPGHHSVRVFYDRYSSPPLGVELHAGRELVLGCRQLESLRINLFTPGRSLVLERLDSRGFPEGAGPHS